MSALQPFIQPASMMAYLFATRLNNNEEFSLIESDIKNRLSKTFFDKPERDENIIYEAQNVIFGKENLDMFTKMIVLIMKYKNLATVLLNYFDDVEKAQYALEEAYQGDFSRKREFTYRYVENLEPIPGDLGVYIDYKRLEKDLFINDFYAVEVGDRTHVFKREA